MSAITVRNLSPETHRALKLRARKTGRSTEAEVRAILEAAVRPPERVKLGDALAALAKPLAGVDLDMQRDKTPAKPLDFE